MLVTKPTLLYASKRRISNVSNVTLYAARTLPAVAHLRLIGVDEASGRLKREYDAAIARAGRVYNIVRSMSLRPQVLRASMGLYGAIMHGESGLSRQERELLATVVSRTNDCHY